VVVTVNWDDGVTLAVICELGVVVTVHCVDGITAPITPVLVATETVSCELGTVVTVAWLLGVVVTVHWLDGITEPTTFVLVAMLETSTVVLPAPLPDMIATGKPALVVTLLAVPAAPNPTLTI